MIPIPARSGVADPDGDYHEVKALQTRKADFTAHGPGVE